MLTRKQHELLLFLHARVQAEGVCPSFDEMKEALNLKSKSGIHRLITGLEERGFIRRLPHRARALEILRLPDKAGVVVPAAAPLGAPAESDADATERMTAVSVTPRFKPHVIRGDFRQALAGRATDGEAAVVGLPLYGRIAAGLPIEALRDNAAMIEIPASLLGGGEHYALEVAGDSMIEAGIFDGDTVIIRQCQAAENGTIIVALVDDHEVTLKRLRRKGNSIALEPANATYETRVFGADRVKVQGRLVGLIRRY
jgi:repressor LexA